MVHLSALTNLDTLSMAYSLAGDPSMAAVAELTQLQHLDLDSCPITNAYVLLSRLYGHKLPAATSVCHLVSAIRFTVLPCSHLFALVRHQIQGHGSQ